jgi:hypothetical protein
VGVATVTSDDDRRCTRCGKSVEHETYQYWLFHTCRHCAYESHGRFRPTGSYRKWRYFPRWHMTRHPDLPEHKRQRRAVTDGGSGGYHDDE